MSGLSRLRGILEASRATAPRSSLEAASPAGAPSTFDTRTLEQIPGGEWRQQGKTRCFVVERRTPPHVRHGHVEVGEIVELVQRAAPHAPLLTTARSPAPPPFLFFDIETTGLSGGAGTYAFLIGCAWSCEDGSLLTRQYMLTCHSHERSMLQIVGAELERAGALVTFNGKSFDAPVVEMRYLFHRLDWVGGRLPHIDVLHPARLFWGGAAFLARGTPHGRHVGLRHDLTGEPGRRSCSLIALEQQVLGTRRAADVPGFEIPARYFQFLRAGNALPLAVVFEHNRYDLLTLAALTARLLQLLRDGPGAAGNAYEALALGRVYQRDGQEDRAVEAFERAMALSGSMEASQAVPIRADALRSLAVAARHARRHRDAAACWRKLLDLPMCPQHAAREALEALAIHHEHRVHDLGAARSFALENLNAATGRRAAARAGHRLARLERKLAVREADSTYALFTP